MTSSSYSKSLNVEDHKRYLEKLKLADKGIDLPDPYSLEDGWLADRSLWPETDYGCIYNYLINTPGPYDGEAMKSFKSLEAFNYFISGHVRGCKYHPISKDIHVCFIKAKVIPGQRVTEEPHKTWVCLDKKLGYVISAHCMCMAGLLYNS